MPKITLAANDEASMKTRPWVQSPHVHFHPTCVSQLNCKGALLIQANILRINTQEIHATYVKALKIKSFLTITKKNPI